MLYPKPVITQRAVESTYNIEINGETAVCPFCQMKNVGKWNVYSGYEWVDTIEACNHFRGFVSGGGRKIVVNFEGYAK